MGSLLRLAVNVHIAGQIVAAVIGSVAVHWMAKRFLQRPASEGKPVSHTPSSTPIDSPIETDDNLAQFLRKTSDGESQGTAI